MKLDDAIRTLARTERSFYLYDGQSMLERAAALKAALPGVHFLYSVKCNPNPYVLHTVFGQGFGADAASAAEVCLAAAAGLPKHEIYYSAPGKTEADLRAAAASCVLIADSLSEIDRIAAMLQGQSAEIGIRVNPSFTFAGAGGAPSKFGIDEADALRFLAENPYKNIRAAGIHVHLKSQETDAGTLSRYYANMLALAQRAEQAAGHPLAFVNMGSGIGVPYGEGDTECDLAALRDAVLPQFAAFTARHPDTRLLIETGRYVTCKGGTYVTTVVDRKQSCGKTFVLLADTLNGFLRPSLARLVAKYAAEADPAGTEPLFTGVNAFPLRVLTAEEQPQTETVTLAGSLCTAADVIAENVTLPRLQPGDLVCIPNAGSYAAVLSPVQFSAQPAPKEYLLTERGGLLG